MTPPTLCDPTDDAALRRDGYVVVDLISPEVVAELLDLCRSLHPEPASAWESDFYSPSAEVKRTVHERLAAGFAPAVERVFVGHHTVLHNFIMNWPGSDGGLVLHQHSSVVDERRFRSVLIWCALTDATEENGTLHVVPGSHLVQVGPRPERSQSWCHAHERQLLADHLVSVPVRAGQALIFDNQLLHCSFPNATDEPRVSAAAIVIPDAAEPLFFEAVGSSAVQVHRLDPAFFLTHEAGDLEWARPEGLELIEERAWSPVVIEASEIASMFGPGTCRHEPS